MIKIYAKPIAIVLFFLCLALLGACKQGSSTAAPSAKAGGGGAALPPREVKVVNSQARQLTRTVTAPGTLAADEQATLSFKVAGRLNNLKVDLGSSVRKGQMIGQLETTEFSVRSQQAEAALQQARVRLGLAAQGDNDRVETENTGTVRQASALLDEARLNLERTKQLVRQGIQSKAELDRLESAFKVADSRYQDAVEEVRNRQGLLLQRRSELAIARQHTALADKPRWMTSVSSICSPQGDWRSWKERFTGRMPLGNSRGGHPIPAITNFRMSLRWQKAARGRCGDLHS